MENTHIEGHHFVLNTRNLNHRGEERKVSPCGSVVNSEGGTRTMGKKTVLISAKFWKKS